MHHKPTIRARAGRQLGEWAERLSRPRNRQRSIIQAAFRVLMELAGFGFFTFAGFQVNSITGAIVAGVCCLVVAAHFGGSDENAASPARG